MENVAFFGDIVLHFPDIVPKILRLDKKWSEILYLSVQYTDSLQYFVDESTKAVISIAKKELDSLQRRSRSKNYKNKNDLTNKNKSEKVLSKLFKLEL